MMTKMRKSKKERLNNGMFVFSITLALIVSTTVSVADIICAQYDMVRDVVFEILIIAVSVIYAMVLLFYVVARASEPVAGWILERLGKHRGNRKHKESGRVGMPPYHHNCRSLILPLTDVGTLGFVHCEDCRHSVKTHDVSDVIGICCNGKSPEFSKQIQLFQKGTGCSAGETREWEI